MSYSAALREHWQDGAPDWIEALAREADLTSCSAVAKRIGRSGALVSQLLRNKYSGDLLACEEVISGKLLDKTVDCPGLGELPLNECRDWRSLSQKFQAVNALRSRMYRACNRCPINKKGGTA